MCVCIILEDISWLKFVVLPNPMENVTLIVFFLSLPTRFVVSAPYFLFSSKTITNLTNVSCANCTSTPSTCN